MAKTDRPRRSVLYMPGSNARALEKGRSVAADGLILDLEDAVAPDAKELARDQIHAALKAGGYGHREIAVRINALSTPWGYQDVVMAATSGADAILIPKVESADIVRQVDAAMTAEGAPDDQAIWCMMETPRGLLRAEEVAQASDRLAVLVMGTSDLAKDLDCHHTPDRLPMITGLGLCMLAARGYGLSILDGVHLDLDDDDGFEYACQQGIELGFDGKTLIHPRTIETCNRIFAPSAAAVAEAKRVIAAIAEAQAEGQGVVVLDGRLVENLHVVEAQRVVAMAEQIEAMAAAPD